MRALCAAQATPPLFFVPLGMKAWFAAVLGHAAAAELVVEMDWASEVRRGRLVV